MHVTVTGSCDQCRWRKAIHKDIRQSEESLNHRFMSFLHGCRQWRLIYIVGRDWVSFFALDHKSRCICLPFHSWQPRTWGSMQTTREAQVGLVFQEHLDHLVISCRGYSIKRTFKEI